MALNHLICPYCGRPIVLDGSHVLQTRWHCPYCSRQLFLLQKAGEISLHGIINTERPESAGPEITVESDTSAEMPSAVAGSDTEPEPVAAEPGEPDEYEQLVRAVAEAARQRHLPRFNSLNRQALTINPTDGRIYAWRAVLTEQADGFTRNCWSSPHWLLRTPSQRRHLLKQHFYALNTALQYIDSHQECQDLIDTLAAQIARQIAEFFTEIANLRLAAKKRTKPFNGRFRKRDLAAAPGLRLALDDLGEIIESDYGPVFRKQILVQLEAENPQLMRRLTV